MRTRRRTATITLVLISSAALQGCGRGNEQPASRDIYRSQADCKRDWGDDEKKCEAVSSGPHAGYFYGPLLYGLARSGSGAQTTNLPRQGTNAIASTNVTRGGFGSSASAHSSGG
jgi:uncharacterized protein YgiB involved in biofilm formation